MSSICRAASYCALFMVSLISTAILLAVFVNPAVGFIVFIVSMMICIIALPDLMVWVRKGEFENQPTAPDDDVEEARSEFPSEADVPMVVIDATEEGDYLPEYTRSE